MKKNVLLLPITLLLVVVTSCSKDNDDLNSINLQADIDKITNQAIGSPWIISRFIDSGNDDTANFNSYGFSFNADGSLVATNLSDTVNGTWSVSGSNSNDCNSCTTDRLTDVLTSCSNWFIDKLEIDDDDKDNVYSGYQFNFSSDGSLRVEGNSTTLEGSWSSSGSGNNIKVTIDVENASELNATWNLHEIELENNESKVDLRIGGDNRLRFENKCTVNPNNTGGSLNDIDLNIFFSEPANFSELSEDWDIVSHSDTKIELIHVSGGNGGTDHLTFEKN